MKEYVCVVLYALVLHAFDCQGCECVSGMLCVRKFYMLVWYWCVYACRIQVPLLFAFFAYMANLF